MTRSPVRCSVCGDPLHGRGFNRRGDAFCCEGCFLKDKEFRAITGALENAYLAFSESLARALDIREKETGLHSKRVACQTLLLARRFTSDWEALRQVYWGGLFHDVGKIGVPDSVLLKEGPLTHEEWVIMRRHPEYGHEIVSAMPFMKEAADMVLHHEERYDGGGYPEGISGDAIPWGARLFAVIDTLDAMTSDRPYRKALSFDDAKTELVRLRGRQFAPEAVDAFLADESALREMVLTKCVYSPTHLTDYT